MGFVKNIINAKVSGNVGSMNFRRRGSSTVAAERSFANKSKGDGASKAQRESRLRVANIVNFFRAIKAVESRAWESKPENISDYSMFVKHNLATSPVFLTKEEAKKGIAVFSNYVVSRGSLPPIDVLLDAGYVYLGIFLGKDFDINNCTIAEFSAALMAHNEGWMNGDKFTLTRLRYDHNVPEFIKEPKLMVYYFEVTLDISNSLPMSSLPGFFNPSFTTYGVNGQLCCLNGTYGCFAIHSRKVSGKLLTSSQSIVLNTPSIEQLEYFSSAEHKELAMRSYGFQDDVLLTPDEI